MRRPLGMLGALALAVPIRAEATDPIGALQPDPLREGATLDAQVSALDTDDVDVNIVLGFEQSWKHSNVRREAASTQPSPGSFVASSQSVAQYTSTTSALLAGA